MFHAHLARTLLLDTSPFRRFTDVGLLAELMTYLPTATVVAEVAGELDDAARSGKNAALAGAIANFGWPKRIPGLSGSEQLAEATILLDILRRAEAGKSHVGEVATILRAMELRVQLVIMDDKTARNKGARPRGLPTITTATLAVEMTHRGALNEAQGWAVFEVSTQGTTFSDFEAAQARAAQPPTPFA